MEHSFCPRVKNRGFQIYWKKLPGWYWCAAQQQMVMKWAGLSLLIILVSYHGVPDILLKLYSIKKKKKDKKVIVPLHHHSWFSLYTQEKNF